MVLTLNPTNFKFPSHVFPSYNTLLRSSSSSWSFFPFAWTVSLIGGAVMALGFPTLALTGLLPLSMSWDEWPCFHAPEIRGREHYT
jgi:hypothetical protein